ncbi:histone acetyltransferase type B catalytic subunit [Centruroides vittatus]|uniref:histone acetyltransferase type B catalytic subunit n=1 Tax=Centruroides vittatus TaxID=120091 RepID=UPI00350E9D18
MAAEGMSLSKGALDAYVCSANSAIEIKLIHTEKDLEEQEPFYPEFTHQFFGDSESIFGYLDLKVKLYYSASRLTTFLGIYYAEQISLEKSEGVEPDNIVKIIGEKLQPGFLTNIDDFTASLSKDANFKPYGELLHSFEQGNDGSVKKCYEIFKCNIDVTGFREYHERMQTFLLWFVDAASYIEVDDDKWDFFVIYEKKVIDGKPIYWFVGYTTVYRYYAYPNKTRPRISQMMILPPFQKKSLGAELLQTIYNWYIQDALVFDITVEDPSDNFTRLRDFVDAKNCLKLTSYSQENLRKGFSEEMKLEAQEKLKLTKKQARRVYEILRLHITNTNNEEEYKAYRLEIKKRLNSPYQRQKSDLAKLQKTLNASEFNATLQCTSREQRIEQLEHQYRELEAEYRHILERLASSDLTN